jgi:hypothetical protein
MNFFTNWVNFLTEEHRNSIKEGKKLLPIFNWRKWDMDLYDKNDWSKTPISPQKIAEKAVDYWYNPQGLNPTNFANSLSIITNSLNMFPLFFQEKQTYSRWWLRIVNGWWAWSLFSFAIYWSGDKMTPGDRYVPHNLLQIIWTWLNASVNQDIIVPNVPFTFEPSELYRLCILTNWTNLQFRWLNPANNKMIYPSWFSWLPSWFVTNMHNWANNNSYLSWFPLIAPIMTFKVTNANVPALFLKIS